MNVFIAWSGDRSKRVSLALRNWLPQVIQSVHPWMSDTDIAAGSRWPNEESKALENSDFGIICLTRENSEEPWILFEAGGLSKFAEKSRVCMYLVDDKPEDLFGPLALFQAKRADKAGTEAIIASMNHANDNANQIDPQRLGKAFSVFWPELEAALKAVPQSVERPKPRPERDMIVEVLELVRAIRQSQVEPGAERLEREQSIGDRLKAIITGGPPRSLVAPEGLLAAYNEIARMRSPYSSSSVSGVASPESVSTEHAKVAPAGEPPRGQE